MQNQIITLSCLALLVSFSHQLLAQKTYVYKESDGTVWFTNVKPTAQDSSRYKLIEIKGRETATKSCHGMNDSKLAARARNYEKAITELSKEFRVDSKLIMAVIRNESCFDRSAVSSAGAEGLMQLMPATAKSLGVSDSFNPQENIRGGTQYLSELIKKYHNNLSLALAAYNAGPGAVAKYDGVPPYPETKKYIKRVMKSYRSYLQDYLVAETAVSETELTDTIPSESDLTETGLKKAGSQ